MIPQGRKDYILQLLNEKPLVTVTELAEAFSLSEVSVRKLLTAMEKEGLLTRSWGGATRAENALHGILMWKRKSCIWKKKRPSRAFATVKSATGNRSFSTAARRPFSWRA